MVKQFLRFPFGDKALVQDWIGIIGRQDWWPSEQSVLCSQHFSHDCFIRTGKKISLKPNATPTIFKDHVKVYLIK